MLFIYKFKKCTLIITYLNLVLTALLFVCSLSSLALQGVTSKCTSGKSEQRAFESSLPLIYIGIHDVSKFNWLPLACTLNVCMSFPGMMQGDNENIKVNLVFLIK